jgi:hypothetical protein
MHDARGRKLRLGRRVRDRRVRLPRYGVIDVVLRDTRLVGVEWDDGEYERVSTLCLLSASRAFG